MEALVAINAKQAVTGEPDAADDRYRPGYELVAERLLQYIAQENLKPGDRLPTEQGLADILDATRNVTREAVKVLAAIGRLSVRKGAGIFVAAATTGFGEDDLAHYQPTDMEQVLMLLDYRRLIETETARRAATLANPVQVRAIRDAAADSAKAGSDNAVEAFAHADAVFHDAVAIASQNVFLKASIANVRRYAAQSDVLLFHGDVPGSLEVAGQQHIAIADAIANGDMDLATALMIEHIDTTQHQFERKIRDRIFTLNNRV
jgi:DNA-binding FadR family transcriptional regulator